MLRHFVAVAFASCLATAGWAQIPSPAPASPAPIKPIAKKPTARTYENLNRAFAGAGARLTQSLRLTEDPLNRLDNAQFPDPPSSAANSATLRERTR